MWVIDHAEWHRLETCSGDITTVKSPLPRFSRGNGDFLWNYRGNNGDGDSSYGNTAVTDTVYTVTPQ